MSEVVDISVGGLRPEVLAFAKAMERKLRENDGKKGSWRAEAVQGLIQGLCAEIDEFCDAMDQGTNEEVLLEAADVANYLMMLVDRVGALKFKGRASRS